MVKLIVVVNIIIIMTKARALLETTAKAVMRIIL